ncbi:MAG: hypoxanthine phosphoribosyltransferase [Bacteroidales bacterium]
MNTVQVLDKRFAKFIESDKILSEVDRIAKEASNDYKGRTPLFLCVLNGSFMFASDLLKSYVGDCQISFIKLSSYQGTQTTEEVKTVIGLNEKIKGRDLIILEDIIDSGITISHLVNDLAKYEPLSLRVATLLLKPDALRTNIKPDYVGIEIPNDFIIGYGLDYNGYGRNLPDIYKIAE